MTFPVEVTPKLSRIELSLLSLPPPPGLVFPHLPVHQHVTSAQGTPPSCQSIPLHPSVLCKGEECGDPARITPTSHQPSAVPSSRSHWTSSASHWHKMVVSGPRGLSCGLLAGTTMFLVTTVLFPLSSPTFRQKSLEDAP